MGAILKQSDQQGCQIWYYRVARSSGNTQNSPPAVIPRMTERRSACFHILLREIWPLESSSEYYNGLCSSLPLAPS